MALFSFGKILTEDKQATSPVVVQSAAPTVGTKKMQEPSFRDLVRASIEQNKQQEKLDNTTDTTTTVIPSIEQTIPETEKLEQKNISIEIPSEEKATVENSTQNLDVLSLPETKTTENESKTTMVLEEKITEEKLVENQNFGTYFLKTMLVEFSDILSAGKELEKLENSKNQNAKDGQELESEAKSQSESRRAIAESLTALFNVEDDKPELLKTALEAYQNYLNEFDTRYRNLIGEKQTKGNKLILEINQKKKDIKKLLEGFGTPDKKGEQIFAEVKKVVSFCKEQRIKTLKTNESISDVIKIEVSNFVTNFVESDLHGAVMLAEQNNLVGIMMRVFNAPTK